MPPAEILRLLRARPFVPFRIEVSGGSIYEIRHPEFVLVGLGFLVLGYPDPSAPEFTTPVDVVATRHVIRLVPIFDTPAQAS